jgi:ATP-binding cassette subfamily F protein 3
VEAREALVEALAGFGGAVVVVSHDRHLLGLIADRLVLVDGGTAQDFAGSLDEYRAMVLRPGNGGRDANGAKHASSKDERRRLAAESRESAKALRKQIAHAESEIKRLSQQRAEIDEMLSRPNTNGSSVAELMKTRSVVERSLASAEQSWIEASEAIERSQG